MDLFRAFATVLFLLVCLHNCSTSDEHTGTNSTKPRRRLKVFVLSSFWSWSHMHYMGTIADTLVEAGHEVHYLKLAPDPVLAEKNETRLAHKLHLLVPKFVDAREFSLGNSHFLQNPFTSGFPMLNALNDIWWDIQPLFRASCTELFSHTALLEELSREQFDVGISEVWEMCSFAMLERIKVHSKIAVLATPPAQIAAAKFGIPTFSSFVPNRRTPLNAPHLTFPERVLNFFNDAYDQLYTYPRINRFQEGIIKRHFGPDFPSVDQLAKSISLFFVNSDPFLEFARPLSNKVVHIGGIVNAKAGPLDHRTKSILDRAQRGVVLFSFGTIIDSRKISTPMRRAILGAFSRFPGYDFIWKLDASQRDNDSALFAAAPNVHVFDWVQQTAILKHPNTRAFISHCGQNSLAEAASAGVPLVAIPIFADQLFNAVLAKHKRMAVHVDVLRLHEEGAEQLMADALEEVLHTPSYRANAQMVQKKLALSPFSPREKLTRWVEFAAEFPELNELNLPTDADMHWLVYYSLDVVLFTTGVLLLTALLALGILRRALKKMGRIWIGNGRKNKAE